MAADRRALVRPRPGRNDEAIQMLDALEMQQGRLAGQKRVYAYQWNAVMMKFLKRINAAYELVQSSTRFYRSVCPEMRSAEGRSPAHRLRRGSIGTASRDPRSLFFSGSGRNAM
jgi:hypothetical protein